MVSRQIVDSINRAKEVQGLAWVANIADDSNSDVSQPAFSQRGCRDARLSQEIDSAGPACVDSAAAAGGAQGGHLPYLDHEADGDAGDWPEIRGGDFHEAPPQQRL